MAEIETLPDALAQKRSSRAPVRIGLTFFEILIAVAVAGLVFSLIFVALPQMQQSQRNTQREKDLARFLTAVGNYQTSHSGRPPFSSASDLSARTTDLVTIYIDESCKPDISYDQDTPPSDACTSNQFRDPDGTIYHFNYLGDADSFIPEKTPDSGSFKTSYKSYKDAAHTIHVFSKATCGMTGGIVSVAGGNRYIAMLMVLEGDSIICATNGSRTGEQDPTETVFLDL